MTGQDIFHILDSDLFLRNHAPRQIVGNRCKISKRTVPAIGVRIQIPLHKPCPGCVVYMICIVMTAEDIPRIQRTVHRKVQMVGFDKFFQICRAEEIFLFSVSIFQIKAVDSELVWHHDINLIRHSSCHPVMSSDGFQPPDLVFILKSDSVHLICPVLLQQAAKT